MVIFTWHKVVVTPRCKHGHAAFTESAMLSAQTTTGQRHDGGQHEHPVSGLKGSAQPDEAERINRSHTERSDLLLATLGGMYRINQIGGLF